MRWLALALVALVGCADAPTEVETDAVFAKGNAPAITISDFAVDDPAAGYLDPVSVSATVTATKLRHAEIIYVRFRLLGDNVSGPEYGADKDHIGLCSFHDHGIAWRGAWFDTAGSHGLSFTADAGTWCESWRPRPPAGDYVLELDAVLWNLNNQKKRGRVRSTVDFTLTD